MADNDTQRQERLKAGGVFLIEAAIAALAASGRLAPWLAFGAGALLLLLAYWPSVPRAISSVTQRIGRKRPRLGVVEAMEAQKRSVGMLRGAIEIQMTAWQNLQDQSKEWHRRIAVDKRRMNSKNNVAITRRALDNAAQIWSTYAGRCLKAANDTSEAADLLRDVIHSKIYWHKKRGTADDLTGENTKEVFSQLIVVVQSHIARLERPMDFSKMEGQSTEMEEAIAKTKRSAEELIAAHKKFIGVCNYILNFHRKHAS